MGKWLIGAVQRTFEPGSMMQYILVFIGDEGALKSWFFRVLGGEFFSDSFRDPQSKDLFGWCETAGSWSAQRLIKSWRAHYRLAVA